MTAWVNGWWIPSNLLFVVKMRVTQMGHVPYLTNKHFPCTILVIWLVQQNLIASRATCDGLVSVNPEWVNYDSNHLMVLTGTRKINELVSACVDANMIECRQIKRSKKQIRITVPFWREIMSMPVDME